MQIFGEVKIKSPFDETLSRDWDEQFAIADEVADAFSIHTEEPWGGSLALLRKARSLTDKLILAKGLHAREVDIYNALEAGADLVLSTNLGMLTSEFLDLCLIEPYTIEELAQMPPEVKTVWNSRDLRTGGLKAESFALARSLFPGALYQASNIARLKDIDPLASGVIIGTHLPSIAEELRQGGRIDSPPAPF